MITLERFEEFECGGYSMYATDSVTDISNWFLNKPKPYRFVYDKETGSWCIGDARDFTHNDIIEGLFSYCDSSADEVYCGMFIPNDYDDYEDQGTDFYRKEIPIESGIIFISYEDDISVFEDLLTKLQRVGALM